MPARLARFRNVKRRRGSITIEAILLLPVFLVVLFATIELGLVLMARQQLLTARREGARVGALGGDESEVLAAVGRVLGDGNLAAADVQTRLTDDSGLPLPAGETVDVIVDLPATAAAPDLLRFIGYSLDGQRIVAR